ncbi:MAG: hypothetical protein RIT81_32555 [Deltaproteobacteria bacterium]
MGHKGAWSVLLLLVGCGFEPTPPSTSTPGGGVVVPIGRAYVGLLALDGTTPPPGTEVNRTSCAQPIRGGPVPPQSFPALTGLVAEASNPGGRLRATLGEDGRTALVGLEGGVHAMTIADPTGRLVARFPTIVAVRRTDVYVEIDTDVDDVDGDGDVEESVMAVDLLPDDDQDRISDTGRRARWWFTADGGVGWVHLGNDFSEWSRIDAQGQTVEVKMIADRDGDFIGDADDPPEAGALPCPGFSHDDLFDPASEHRDFTCERCHRSDDEVPLACQDCHSPLGRVPDEVPEAAPVDHFLVRCEQCHVANQDWDAFPGPNGEKHEAFRLEGHHLRTDCFSCHESQTPKPPKLCVECHLADRSPDHYRDTCEACHVAADWKPPVARHDDFPLAGGHADVDCEGCHSPPEFVGLSTDCETCHADDAPPRHTPAGFTSEPCANCHVIDAWPEHRYAHPHWPLEGQHASAACADCHGADDTTPYAEVSSDCATCHTPPSFPDHSNAAVFEVCADCHRADGWVPADQGSIDHSVFPLTGAHATALCSTCHEGGTLPRPPTACTDCHLEDRPARHVGFFDGDCAGCHQATTWAELTMPYAHTADFPLAGVHQTEACSTCHNGATYDAPADCVSCHVMDRPPNHYGDACAQCHVTSDWNPSGELNHHTVDPQAFPLTGQHATLLCSECHTSGFSALPENCEACHLNDQPAGHATAACATCHVAAGWGQPTQPPAGVIHPLAGQHNGRTCVSCHGNFTNGAFAEPDPNSTCATCHALPGGHFAVGATDCGGCHMVSGWLPAAGGHQGPVPSSPFPYNTWSGRWFPTNHRSANQCSDCHPDSANFAFFSCTNACHRNRNDMDDHHDSGTRAQLYHFDAMASHSPPNEGGGPWPSAHVGCVKSNCHADGRD